MRPGETIYTGISLGNVWDASALVERIELVGVTPGLDLVHVALARPGTDGDLAGVVSASGDQFDELRLDEDYRPLPAELAGHNAYGEGRLTIGVSADQPGEYSYDAVAVDYRVGPFSFRATHHLALVVCLVPMPPGTVCSLDSA